MRTSIRKAANVIRIAIQNLVDDLEQLSLFASGKHPLDDRREDANHFVYFPVFR
jgi:hypothetical protein